MFQHESSDANVPISVRLASLPLLLVVLEPAGDRQPGATLGVARLEEIDVPEVSPLVTDRPFADDHAVHVAAAEEAERVQPVRAEPAGGAHVEHGYADLGEVGVELGGSNRHRKR